MRNASKLRAGHMDADTQAADELPADDDAACTDCLGTFARSRWRAGVFPGWRTNTYRYGTNAQTNVMYQNASLSTTDSAEWASSKGRYAAMLDDSAR